MVNDMEEKKADNTINKQKARIKEIDNKIDIEKDKTKQLDEIEEIVVSLNKNINKCLELLGVSIQGNNIDKRLSAIESENNVNYKKNISNIELHREVVQKNIKKLNDEKEKIINEKDEDKRGED